VTVVCFGGGGGGGYMRPERREFAIGALQGPGSRLHTKAVLTLPFRNAEAYSEPQTPFDSRNSH
jgi:hypothetical protein